MLILCEEKGGDRMNLFFVFLGTAAWQDLRTRSISLEVLAGGAAVGIITCIWKERLPGENRSGDDSWNYAFAVGMLTRGSWVRATVVFY